MHAWKACVVSQPPRVQIPASPPSIKKSMSFLNKISEARLSNQQITESNFKEVKDLVTWMGAIQAQDYNMAKWAIGLRLANSTDKTIEEALNKGEVIRTHILRPTWHFISPDDVSWMLDLTAEQIKSTMRSSDKLLGITKDIFEKSNIIIHDALTQNKYLTRKELSEFLNKANIKFKDPRAYRHIIFNAEIDGIVCSGPIQGEEQTYVILSRLVKKQRRYKKDEGLYELAKRYFTSHGPATLYDFSWWSGLRINDSQRAIELINKEFPSEKIGSKTYWFPQNTTHKNTQNAIHLLPAYDEFIISYKDRSPSLQSRNQRKVSSVNGIFKPIIVFNGEIIGTWKRISKKNTILIETTLFQAINKEAESSIEKEVEQYGLFLNQKVDIKKRFNTLLF